MLEVIFASSQVNGQGQGQVETDETENGNGKLKRKTETESGNGKAEIRKWSSQLFQELPFAHARIVCYARISLYRELASTRV